MTRYAGVRIGPVRPSAAIRVAYDKRLAALVDALAADVSRVLLATYRADPPLSVVLYGQDASPLKILQSAMRGLTRDWLSKFNELGPKLADRFASDVRDRNDRAIAADLRKARFTVRFKMTAGMREAYGAVLSENVALISSLPAEHLAGVEQLVMRSVAAGRDLGTLAKGLEKRHGITRRRAARIAVNQNNSATAILARTRYLEMGLTRAIWLHSAGGTTPRPTHVAFSGKTFDLREGVVLEPDEGIVWPGTAINCRCVMRPAIEGIDY